MRIGVDLRFIKNDLYSVFVLELIKELILKDNSITFTIYTNIFLEGLEQDNVAIKKVSIYNGSIKEQFTYNRILKKDKNNLMLFFNHYKPIFYKGDYYILLYSLKKVYYNNFANYYTKYKYLYLLEKNIQNSNKVICFDQNTTNELIEKFNINDKNIEIVNGFFPLKDKLFKKECIEIDIKTKYNLKNKYFIYSGGEGNEKNYEKLINVFYKFKKEGTKIDLVFLGETISKNILLRNIILKLKMQENIFFIGLVKLEEKILIYKNSLGTIFPSLYEPFPFRLTEPLFLNQKIISSNLKSIKQIFGDNISYFSPISTNSIYTTISIFLENNNNNTDYNNIVKEYTKEKTADQLLKLIK